MNDTLIIQRLDRIEKAIKALSASKKSSSWIGAADLMRLTGWNKDDMYRMRKAGVVGFKKVGKSIAYDLDSVPAVFIKAKT